MLPKVPVISNTYNAKPESAQKLANSHKCTGYHSNDVALCNGMCMYIREKVWCVMVCVCTCILYVRSSGATVFTGKQGAGEQQHVRRSLGGEKLFHAHQTYWLVVGNCLFRHHIICGNHLGRCQTTVLCSQRRREQCAVCNMTSEPSLPNSRSQITPEVANAQVYLY